ncbi:MAG: carboxypeptidase-like regulatory domain-containing protein [Desulfobacterales bacterium]|nr:carboxypeptidase-like regulatory domain-containing protein [Desulfobacterales bacterium]
MNKKIIRYGVSVLLLMLSLGGCVKLPMTGKVLDTETGHPVEGAVVHAEWTVTKGCLPSLTFTELYKTSEAVTNKNGNFFLPGVLNPLTDLKPKFIIYKKGYIAWRAYATFPDYNHEREKNFDWRRRDTFRLERFVEGAYSYSDHISYFEMGLEVDIDSKLKQAYGWEYTMRRKESDLYIKKWHSPTRGNKTRKQIRKEILHELYMQKKENENE